jgi:hypothetical protein
VSEVDQETTPTRRRRTIAITTAAGVAALGVGGLAWYGAHHTDPMLAEPAARSAPGVPLAPQAGATAARPQGARPSPTASRRRNPPKARWPKPPATPMPVAAAADVPVSRATIGSVPRDGHMIQVYAARTDLSHARQMTWVADDGFPVGDARCSQTFRLSAYQAPKERPTMLICWRMSAHRSVYTVAVAPKGRPSTAASVDALDRAWAKLS